MTRSNGHTRQCGTCSFFRKIQGRASGTCHANPPIPVMVGMGQNPVTQQPTPVILTYWPELGAHDFCGHYAIAVTSIDMTKLADVVVEGEA